MSKERKTIYLCLAHMSEEGWEQKYVKEAFDTNWVVPMGPNVNTFEKDLEAFANSKSDGSQPLDRKVVCLSAGTAAVHLALIGCGVKAGDEVLVQSYTFCASSHPITYLGAKPIFIGSEGETWNMDPQLLEKAIIDRKEKTGKYPKAISIKLWRLLTNIVSRWLRMLPRAWDLALMDKSSALSAATEYSLSTGTK